MKKKWIAGLATIAALALILVGCGKSSSDSSTIKIYASSTPHAEILNHVKKQLKKEGVTLEITKAQDYNIPNKLLAQGKIQANYFQHTPFLNNWNKKNNGTLISAGKVHLEPIGIYSKKYQKLTDLPNNATVLVSSNVSDYGRVLTLFKDAGLITLKPGTKITTATFSDIKDNKKNLQFKTDYDANVMPKLYQNNSGDAIVINANYAEQAGINPTKTAIDLEKNSSPYANIVAVQKGDKNKPAIKKLMKALQSKSTQQWIQKHYKGAVVPVYPNGK